MPKQSVNLLEQIGMISELLDFIPDIVFIKDLQSVYLGGNSSLSKQVGKSLKEILGHTDLEIYPEEVANLFRRQDQKVFETGQTCRFNEYIVNPQGSPILMETLKTPITNSEGSITGLLGISHDVSSPRQTDEIAEVERKLAAILTQKSTLADALPSFLSMAIQVSGMDSGGIYLLSPTTGVLELISHQGIPESFIKQAQSYQPDSPNYSLVMRGKPIYFTRSQIQGLKEPLLLEGKVTSFALLPLVADEKVVACIQVASHSKAEIPAVRRHALENLAGSIGNMIVRFQMQQVLIENRDELQSMFDSLQDLIFVLDKSARIIQVNRQVLEQLGYTWEEIIDVSVLMVHPEDRREEARRIVEEMLAGTQMSCPIPLLRKDGSLLPVETRVAPGRWGNQDVLIGISRNMSERMAAEEERLNQTALLEYRNKFEQILTTSSTRLINLPTELIDQEITAVLGMVGEFEKVDRSYLFLFDDDQQSMNNTHEWCAPGVEPAIDMLQDLPLSIFPWWIGKLTRNEDVYIPIVAEMTDEAEAEREILQAQSIQSILVVPIHLNKKLSGFLGFDSVAHQRYWSHDSILMIHMVGDIISNALMRRQMESSLLQSEARNRALLSAVPDLIFRINRDGTFLDYKASTPRILAMSPEKIIGANLREVLGVEMAEQAVYSIDRALDTGEIQTLEYSLSVHGATSFFEARFIRSGKEEVTTIVRDISERVRLEQMKSDFINRATHELRTPVATMMLMKELIDADPTPEEFSEYWAILKNELTRERTLVEDLLTAGRLENNQTVLHCRTFDLAHLLKESADHAAITTRGKDLNIQFSTGTPSHPGDGYMIEADENALKQVFGNLIGNAVKFTPGGGKVNITLDKVKDGYEIKIEDTGMGIPSEDLPLLFTRFFRGTNAIHEEIPGTGIGLYIVNGIVENHSGEVSAVSQLGKGSCFTVWLPARQRA